MSAARVQNRVLTVLLALLLLGTIEVVAPATASAYALSGCRYTYKPVQYYLATSLPANVRSGFSSAASDWTSLTRADMTSALPGGLPRVNVVSSNYGSGAFEARVAEFQTCAGAPNGNQNVQVNSYYSYTAQRWRSIGGHEFGHALGLAHAGAAGAPCTSVPLMHPFTNDRYVRCGFYTPRADDINGIHQYY